MPTSHVDVRFGTVTLPAATPQLLKGVIGAEVKALRHGVADVLPEYRKEPFSEAVMSNDTTNR
jgi:hypothetical protein